MILHSIFLSINFNIIGKMIIININIIIYMMLGKI